MTEMSEFVSYFVHSYLKLKFPSIFLGRKYNVLVILENFKFLLKFQDVQCKRHIKFYLLYLHTETCIINHNYYSFMRYIICILKYKCRYNYDYFSI